ncbi:ABC transporter permease subunit [Streptomyces sp. H27-C3]|uniref:ABC transporter permease n=1 Tax=Streptomyces sp. H27-C3 TaxID=3046305 RepID=UPI0024BAEAFD|nr:ABC transporter permease subunit [Streptomyces sp. H27-C3]MDJ0462282.1 ABC transporter permease subunit [Streptomyces sp. H27-C3]
MTTPYQQVPPQYQQQGVASYVSPIPVRRANLADALASEWTKIRSVRSTMWTLGVMILLVLGVGLIIALVLSSTTDSGPVSEPALVLGVVGTMLGSICIIALGVLTVSSEYGTGMIRTTLTACPSRSRVLTAKAIVFFLLSFAITTVSTTVVGLLQTAIVNAPNASADVWLRSTVGVGLFMALLGLVSLAVGSMLRHSAGGITVMIGLFLFPLVLAMFMFSESLVDVQQALFQYAIPSQLAALYGAELSESGPAGWEPVWIMLGVAVLALGGAFLALEKRDV